MSTQVSLGILGMLSRLSDHEGGMEGWIAGDASFVHGEDVEQTSTDLKWVTDLAGCAAAGHASEGYLPGWRRG